MMRLVYLTANAAYVFSFGGTIIQMGDNPRFFSTKAAAILAARECRLDVTRSGEVHAID